MNTVDVRYARVAESAPGGFASLDRLLSDDERKRAARFAFPRDRHTYVAGHALLRLMLSERAGVDPQRWRFRTGDLGRPEVDGPEARLGLRFSLSHTRGLAACAVTTDVAVGVDVEALDRRVPLELAPRCLMQAEGRTLSGLRPESRPGRFLELWTLKEALLKAMGVGITGPMNRIAFSVDGPGPVLLDMPTELDESPEAWQFASRRIEGRYRLAVAVRSGASERPVVVTRASHPAPETVSEASSLRFADPVPAGQAP